jgi:SAM-dependent methyltransferase
VTPRFSKGSGIRLPKRSFGDWPRQRWGLSRRPLRLGWLHASPRRPSRDRKSVVKPYLQAIIRCPRCHGRIDESAEEGRCLALYCSSPDCKYSKSGFPILDNTPVLIDFDRSILDRNWIMQTRAASTKSRGRSWLGRLTYRLRESPGPSGRNAQEFLSCLKATNRNPVVLVVGGAVVGHGAEALYRDESVRIVGTDIYRSDLTDVVADGHQLPIANRSVDGVWIQAVLEHVLEPHKVVNEIHRVLLDGGYVYAETPFMQQVHEGAFDFTRFTPTGHRWLFRGFQEVSSGVTRGPGTVLVWSIRYFVAALFRSYRIGNAVAGLLFWLEYLDRLLDRRFAMDGPSGVFFLGRSVERSLEPRDIVSTYRGAL